MEAATRGGKDGPVSAALSLIVAFPLVALAQTPTTDEINDRIQAVAMQRNDELDRVAVLTAELAKAQRALEAAKKAADACKPAEEPKK